MAYIFELRIETLISSLICELTCLARALLRRQKPRLSLYFASNYSCTTLIQRARVKITACRRGAWLRGRRRHSPGLQLRYHPITVQSRTTALPMMTWTSAPSSFSFTSTAETDVKSRKVPHPCTHQIAYLTFSTGRTCSGACSICGMHIPAHNSLRAHCSQCHVDICTWCSEHNGNEAPCLPTYQRHEQPREPLQPPTSMREACQQVQGSPPLTAGHLGTKLHAEHMTYQAQLDVPGQAEPVRAAQEEIKAHGQAYQELPSGVRNALSSLHFAQTQYAIALGRAEELSADFQRAKAAESLARLALKEAQVIAQGPAVFASKLYASARFKAAVEYREAQKPPQCHPRQPDSRSSDEFVSDDKPRAPLPPPPPPPGPPPPLPPASSSDASLRHQCQRDSAVAASAAPRDSAAAAATVAPPMSGPSGPWRNYQPCLVQMNIDDSSDDDDECQHIGVHWDDIGVHCEYDDYYYDDW